MRKLRIARRNSSSGLQDLNPAIVHAVQFRTTTQYIGLTGMDFKSTYLTPM